MKNYFISLLGIAIILVGCNTNHTSEFNKIDRYNIKGYEEFILKYPNSIHINDARERINVARKMQKKAIEEAEQQRIVAKYGNNSLPNGSQPYSKWYGGNSYYDNYTPHSEIRVKAPHNSDVITIVRRNNHNGAVVGHKYIKAGNSVTIYLRNGDSYQTFFYYGNGWNPNKKMKNGIIGGFVKNEAYSKDGTASYMNNNILTYELVLTQNGNFRASSSDENEVF